MHTWALLSPTRYRKLSILTWFCTVSTIASQSCSGFPTFQPNALASCMPAPVSIVISDHFRSVRIFRHVRSKRESAKKEGGKEKEEANNISCGNTMWRSVPPTETPSFVLKTLSGCMPCSENQQRFVVVATAVTKGTNFFCHQ